MRKGEVLPNVVECGPLGWLEEILWRGGKKTSFLRGWVFNLILYA